MKAILVIDMPESCYECQFQGMGGRDLELLTCSLNHWCVDNPNERPSWCPLRPLPSKRKIPFTKTFGTPFNKGKAKGWNDCIDAIISDTDGTKGEK